MVHQPTNSFRAFFSHDPRDDVGNKNTRAFTDALDNINEDARIGALTSELKSIFFSADNNGKIQIVHSPINFGGSRMRPEHKNFFYLRLF